MQNGEPRAGGGSGCSEPNATNGGMVGVGGRPPEPTQRRKPRRRERKLPLKEEPTNQPKPVLVGKVEWGRRRFSAARARTNANRFKVQTPAATNHQRVEHYKPKEPLFNDGTKPTHAAVLSKCVCVKVRMGAAYMFSSLREERGRG